MKDNEMIEEMAKVIESIKLYGTDNYERKISRNSALELAEELLKHYQPKLPEDSVVLSREEHETLVKIAQGKIGSMKANEFIKACLLSGWAIQTVSTEEQVKQARKEMAEKFARDIFNHITTPEVWEKLRQLWLSKDGNFNANKHIYNLLIEPIAKLFGVEIKE